MHWCSVIRINILLLAFLMLSPAVAKADGGILLDSDCVEAKLKEIIDAGGMNGITVVVRGLARGEHGGHRYIVEPMPGKGWNDGSDVEAPQGDARWAFDMLGERAAKFFGYHMKKTFWGKILQVTRPNMKELLGAIRKYNEFASPKAQIRMTLYEETDQKSPLRKVVRRFARDAALPVAPRGAYFHHDMNYHAPTIWAMPQEFTEHAMRQRMALVDFEDFLQRHHRTFLRSHDVQAIFNAVYGNVAKGLDLSTGALAQFFTGERFFLTRSDPSFHLNYEGGYTNLNFYCAHGLSPRQYLIENLNPNIFSIKGTPENKRRMEKDLQRLNQLMQQFISRKSRLDESFSKDLGIPADAKDIIKKAKRRIKEIQEIIRQDGY